MAPFPVLRSSNLMFWGRGGGSPGVGHGLYRGTWPSCRLPDPYMLRKPRHQPPDMADAWGFLIEHVRLGGACMNTMYPWMSIALFPLRPPSSITDQSGNQAAALISKFVYEAEVVVATGQNIMQNAKEVSDGSGCHCCMPMYP